MFSRFRRQISKNTNFAEIVQRLDFSQFTSVGLGRTRRMNLEIQNLTAATFLDCLTKVPNLQELLVQEHLEDDLDDKVISKIFLGLPLLKAIDFCAASSPKFQNAFNSVITVDNLALPLQFNIRRFSLHECNTLPASAFEIILPRMAHLTHLDVFHTRISDKALLSIPCSAQLSHLNIGRCNGLSGKIIVNFLTSSTIACELIFLGIYSDVSSNQLLSSEDIDCLLPNLPNSLKSLNLNGAEINSTHISALVSLTKHLEELSLGHADLSIDDIKALFAPSEYRFSTEKTFYESPEEELWIQPALHYLDLTGVPCVTPGSFISTLSVLLLPKTKPLEVLEVGALAIQGLKQRSACTKRLGWVVTECGRRGWLVREPSTDAYTHSNSGRRSWKMGAVWWGMRKVPVADAEVGGLYGHYMFKK
ncbi:MAG: hypothetical protein M1829_005650 [Trizodia sp. TS-e1964]|nr:MAG: hypothetical protein M1829_005650 [Trizodia sp. TS-e1964]